MASPAGWSRDAWADYAAMGWLALPADADAGGFAGDPEALGALMHYAGQALAMRAPLPRLTPTQIKVLRGVHSGLLNKQIAFYLGIAEATVKAHMTALMRKLNVRNRTQVAVLAHTLMLQAA